MPYIRPGNPSQTPTSSMHTTPPQPPATGTTPTPMTTPDAPPPAARTDPVEAYTARLLDLTSRPQWASMSDGTRARALDILKAAADTALKSVELAHVEALTRNSALVAAGLAGPESTGAGGAAENENENAAVAAKTRWLRAETERMEAATALEAAQEERWRAEVRKMVAEDEWRKYKRLREPKS